MNARSWNGCPKAAPPVHLKAGRVRGAAVADIEWQHPLPAQDAVPRRHDRAAFRHVIFEPLDFIARLATLVPKPRVNLTRFHGVFAPNSKHRALVTPAKRGKGNKVKVLDEPQTLAERRASMTWAQRLKRVFTKSRRFRRHRY